MHDSRGSKQVLRGLDVEIPEVRQSDCGCSRQYGYAVPYASTKPNAPHELKARIQAAVLDRAMPTGPRTKVCFIVDTGSPVTVVPQRSVRHPAGRSLGAAKKFVGFGGEAFLMRPFEAQLVIHRATNAVSGLQPLIIQVVAYEPLPGAAYWPYGLLGLDALRQVMMVADDRRLCLWPLGASPSKTDTDDEGPGRLRLDRPAR